MAETTQAKILSTERAVPRIYEEAPPPPPNAIQALKNHFEKYSWDKTLCPSEEVG